MFPLLDKHLAALFNGEVDDGNSDSMLDAIIFGAAREAVPDLAIRRCDHIDTLRRLIIRRISDRDDIRLICERRLAERDAKQDDFDKICLKLTKYEEV
ncbi:MAG: hypothetical protein LUG52_09295 [Clostridia bacterium]|nr:hypothetical protein [Clostridia bacterium]